MHEASVAQSVFDTVNEIITTDPDAKNRDVEKIIFTLSHPYTVYPDSFSFYFEELVKGTVLEKIELVFEETNETGFFIKSLILTDEATHGN